jgi:hypothetical protein
MCIGLNYYDISRPCGDPESLCYPVIRYVDSISQVVPQGLTLIHIGPSHTSLTGQIYARRWASTGTFPRSSPHARLRSDQRSTQRETSCIVRWTTLVPCSSVGSGCLSMSGHMTGYATGSETRRGRSRWIGTAERTLRRFRCALGTLIVVWPERRAARTASRLLLLTQLAIWCVEHTFSPPPLSLQFLTCDVVRENQGAI